MQDTNKKLGNLRLFAGSTIDPVFQSEDVEEIWREIGNLPFGCCYEVLDSKGESVPEFIPF